MTGELAPGTVLAGCRVDGVLARGGMGVVYRATELRLGRAVALKLIAGERAADPAFRERFEREARMTAAIEHPNVVPVYAAGEEDGHLYLVMRFVDGTDLHALLRREGRLDPERAAAIVAQVADALDAAHAAGLVHRDVKPGNVLLAGDHAYLGDFGITRDAGAETATDSGEWLGTVDFTSPEHLRGERTDARSDVYALGCVLYAALTGAPPFHRATVPATIAAHLDDPPPRLGGPFDEVLATALAKDPADRYPSAGDLGRAALAAARGEPSTAVTAATGSVARGQAAPIAPAPPVAERVARGPAAPEPTLHSPTRRIAPPPPVARRRTPRWGRLAGMLALVALLAAGVAAVVVALTGGGSGTKSGPLSATEVRRTAEAFARAYGREDDRALALLLTPEAQRVSPGDVQRGRAAVVAEYRRQFDTSTIRAYRLSALVVTPGRVGRASASFSVPRAGRPPITGHVVLAMERLRGRPRIGLIATEPRS